MIKKAAQGLDTLPTGYETKGFQYRGYDIYMKPNSNHLLFYTVDEEKDLLTNSFCLYIPSSEIE